MNIRFLRSTLFCSLMLLLQTSCDNTENSKSGSSSAEAVIQENPPESTKSKYDELLDKANSGNIDAQFELAEKLNAGDGIQENDKEAFKWYELAAKNNHVEAILTLSHAYAMPDATTSWLSITDDDPKANLYLFVQQDEKKARLMAEELAATGNPKAINYAYYMNLNTDKQKALYWLKRAASQGHSGMMGVLAVAYVSGEIVSKDIVLARAWMHLEMKPKNRYESMFGKETPEQISLAVGLAERWSLGKDIVRLPDGNYDVVSFAENAEDKVAAIAMSEVSAGSVNGLMMQSVRCHVNGDALLNTSSGNLITDTELVKYSHQGDDKGICQIKIWPKGVHWESCFYDSNSELYSNSDGRKIDKKVLIENRKSGSQDDGWNGDCLLKDSQASSISAVR